MVLKKKQESLDGLSFILSYDKSLQPARVTGRTSLICDTQTKTMSMRFNLKGNTFWLKIKT